MIILAAIGCYLLILSGFLRVLSRHGVRAMDRAAQR